MPSKLFTLVIKKEPYLNTDNKPRFKIKDVDVLDYVKMAKSKEDDNAYPGVYLFYNNGDDYEASLNNYSSTLYDTKEYKDIYCLYIKIKTITNNEDKSIKDVILDMYNDTSKYEIIN